MGQSSSTQEDDTLVAVGETRMLRSKAFKYIRWFRTIWGLVACVMLFSAALDSMFSLKGIVLGIIMLVEAIVMFLLEAGFVLRSVCGTDGVLCRAFGFVLLFDRLKRALLYFLFTVPPFISIFPDMLYCRIAAVMVFVTGILYALKLFEYKKVPVYVSNPNMVRSRQGEPATMDVINTP